MAAAERRSVRILGVRVDDVTMNEAVQAIRRMALSAASHQVVTVNAEFVMRAQQDADFRVVLGGAALALADGYGIIWAARRLRQPLRERVAGSDAVPRLCEMAAAEGLRVFFLGAAEGVVVPVGLYVVHGVLGRFRRVLLEDELVVEALAGEARVVEVVTCGLEGGAVFARGGGLLRFSGVRLLPVDRGGGVKPDVRVKDDPDTPRDEVVTDGLTVVAEQLK